MSEDNEAKQDIILPPLREPRPDPERVYAADGHRFQDALLALGCRWSPIWAGGDDGGTGCMDVKIDSGGYDADPVHCTFFADWIEVWAYVKEGDLSVVATIRYDDPNFIRDLLAAVAGDFIQPETVTEKEND